MESLPQYMSATLSLSVSRYQPPLPMAGEPELEDDGDRVARQARIIEERRSLAA